MSAANRWRELASLRGLEKAVAARLPALGERTDGRPAVAVVKLHGVITPTPSSLGRGTISLHTVESALTRAFDHDRLAAVALSINSPGGAPAQSAMVADRIRGLATKKSVPVLAFCEDVAASGGYWLACAADEIYAHGTSLVGSIGVISASLGWLDCWSALAWSGGCTRPVVGNPVWTRSGRRTRMMWRGWKLCKPSCMSSSWTGCGPAEARN